MDLKTRQGNSFIYEMLGMLEAMDAAYSVMKDPKDIMLIDLDNQGKWKIIPKNQVDMPVKDHCSARYWLCVVWYFVSQVLSAECIELELGKE